MSLKQGESGTHLFQQIRSCQLCRDLPLGPRPVFQASPTSRILIASQAPGRKAHASGIPFDDASGDRLRVWLGLDRDSFYDEGIVAIVPMGLCYPGTGSGGDLPPAPVCAEKWRRAILDRMPAIEMTLLIGRYALTWHLPETRGRLTETVRNWHSYWPDIVPLPHPSPRNNGWLKVNPWFEKEVVPAVRDRISLLLARATNGENLAVPAGGEELRNDQCFY